MMQTPVWVESISWLETIRTVAPVATAVIAFAALRNWQRQDKAKREAEFLDELLDAAHAYIADLPTPITMLEMAKVGMASYAPTWENEDEAIVAMKGAVAFIEKNGEHTGKQLFESLATIRASVVRLRSLSAKGQVFNFGDYASCQRAVAMLTWQFDRMEGVAAFIRSSSWNWENPVVRQRLTDIMQIDASEMRTGVQDSHVALLEFARGAYKRIYG